MKRLPDLEAWAIFARVGELGSFARAAADLGLSKPTVSKAIGRLEARLGLSLFNRTSRRLSLTDSGRVSLERAALILREGVALQDEAMAQSDTPRGRLRIGAPLSFGIAYLGAALAEFMADYPEITLDLALSDRHVDVVAEGFDLAIRIARLDDSSLLARKLCDVRLLLVASPAYLDRHGRPTHPAELADHRAMIYSGGITPGVWRFSHPVFGETAIEPGIHVWTDNADLLAPMLTAGEGIALQPEFLVWREMRAGTLEHVMPQWTTPAPSLYLLMPPNPLRPLRVRLMIDHLARSLKKPPWADAQSAAGSSPKSVSLAL